MSELEAQLQAIRSAVSDTASDGVICCQPMTDSSGSAASASSGATEGYTLLEQLEAGGVEVPYQCREGYCGRCRTKKLSGEVAYISAPLAWVNSGEILPCCCVAVSEVVLELYE